MKMSEAKWYVIHTYSGYENKVADNLATIVENRKLQDLIHEIRVPTETVTEVKPDGKTREVERKVFPGYVLIKMVVTDDSWFIVRNIRGVTGFVGASSTAPVPLSDKEVEKLGVEKHEVVVNYKVGDNVSIIDGPLEGFVGIVEVLEPEKNHVRVVISMFGRETPVELELSQVKPVD
jgi:transcriptional antiterminator NusG